jgi:hypothetical protein
MQRYRPSISGGSLFLFGFYSGLTGGSEAGAERVRGRASWIFHAVTCRFGHSLGSPSE